MMKKVIYAIKNKSNGKYYVGQTMNCNDRRLMHFWKLKEGEHTNKELQGEYNILGNEQFEFIILEELSDDITREEMLTKEDGYIIKLDAINNGYNKSMGGTTILTAKKNRIKVLILKNISPNEIADKMGVGHTTVWNYRNEMIAEGILSPDTNLVRIPRDTEDSVKQDLLGGMKNKDVIEKYGINKAIVIRYKKELGLSTKKQLTDEERQSLIPRIMNLLLSDSKITVKEVSQLFKVSTKFIQDIRQQLVDSNKLGGRWQPTDEERIVMDDRIKQLLISGKTIDEVSDECGVYKDYVIVIRNQLSLNDNPNIVRRGGQFKNN